jgi:hypothetical protein
VLQFVLKKRGEELVKVFRWDTGTIIGKRSPDIFVPLLSLDGGPSAAVCLSDVLFYI